jgi:putative SOS response-associated peptidase YedK
VQKTRLGEICGLLETMNAVPNAAARYNAAPTDSLAVVRYYPQTRQRSLELLGWGLLMSERASYVTGVAYNVDGGWMAV